MPVSRRLCNCCVVVFSVPTCSHANIPIGVLVGLDSDKREQFMAEHAEELNAARKKFANGRFDREYFSRFDVARIGYLDETDFMAMARSDRSACMDDSRAAINYVSFHQFVGYVVTCCSFSVLKIRPDWRRGIGVIPCH